VIVDIEVRRDGNALHNWGKMFVDGVYWGETLEDTDRHLEDGGIKIAGETAAPKGRFHVVLSPSQRFGKTMPELLNVPGFRGVRIHGGNTEANTEGCILLGQYRTAEGIANCAGINQRLIEALRLAAYHREVVWITIS